MNTNKLRAAALVTTLMLSVPIAMSEAGTAVAIGHQTARPTVEVNVGYQGAAMASACSEALSSLTEIAGQRSAATTSSLDAPSRLSGLPFGGAAAYNPEVDGPPPIHPSTSTAPSTYGPSRLSGLPFGGAGDCM